MEMHAQSCWATPELRPGLPCGGLASPGPGPPNLVEGVAAAAEAAAEAAPKLKLPPFAVASGWEDALLAGPKPPKPPNGPEAVSAAAAGSVGLG